MKTRIFLIAVLLIIGISQARAQTTAFSYQGKLTDGGNPANGNYDLSVQLFDTASVGTGTQQGTTLNLTNVPVSEGIFTVQLDFGACANCFNGASRFLEIAVRPSGGSSFTTLSPRQPITSTPYAVKSLKSVTADGLSLTCVSCVTSGQIQSVQASQVAGNIPGSQINGSIPVASVPAGSASYIQNTTAPQANSNFNISGNGTVGGALSGNTVNSATQYNIGGTRVLGFFPDNLLKLGTNNRVSIGANLFPGYWLEVESPDKNGLRVGTSTPGGKVLSLGGVGNLEVDAPGVVAGRFLVHENGNVGIGVTAPASKLAVSGTVESTSGGFKFPDGSLLSSAKVFSTSGLADLELDHSGGFTSIITLNLPPGVYLLMATVHFENRANDLFQDNTRPFRCNFQNDFVGVNRLGAPGNPMDHLTTTFQRVFTQSGNGPVSLRCGDSFNDTGKVFAKMRHFTAVRMVDNPNAQ